MKKSFAVIFVLLFSVCCFGQETAKTIKFYQGDDYMPYIFEPYRAEYLFKGKVAGIPFRLFTFSTRIIELQDEWEETQQYRLEFLDYFPDADAEKELLREIEMTTKIDLKTGLLKSTTARLSSVPDGNFNVNLMEAGKIIVTGIDGKRSDEKIYETREKLYPCSFSTTFLSYLPLSDDFAGSFSCFELDKDDNSNKDVVRFYKRTLRVVGTETVTVDGGTFECYKLADEAEEIKYNRDGSIKSKKKIGKREFDEEKFWKNFFNNAWIDKKSRKPVKAELLFKIGSLTMELQKPRSNYNL